MDFAYIAEHERSATPRPSEGADSETETTSTTPTRSNSQPQRQTLQAEFQESLKAFSSSPWGSKLGGWWSTARTQGASYYETARREAEKREAEAAKALEEARKVVVEKTKVVVEAAEHQLDNIVNEDKKAELEAQRKQQHEEAEAQTTKEEPRADPSDPTPSEADTETFLNRFRSEAAKRLKEVQKAEDAADEALLRFGTNIRNFLKDTISITAPEPSDSKDSSEVLFESRDATTGKRVIHTSRFDAQLHVIHTTPSSFTTDPDASDDQWETFKSDFDVEKNTDVIAADLEKHPDLRSTMEKLVPEQVEYKDFWTRYYFLRHVVGLQEEKRKELLKASTADDEEQVAWDEDSDDESRPKTAIAIATTSAPSDPQAQTTPSQARHDSDAMTLKAPRRSHDEKSVADSEASYDLVSGAVSHANSSPKEKPVRGAEEETDDDDDDWE